jgi:hypothetical protein
LAFLALVPLGAVLALSVAPDDWPVKVRLPQGDTTPRAGWALAWANFWFICATMMVWSLSGALAVQAGHSEGLIGRAVAIGSLVGAATAIAVMRERLRVPLPVTACLVGAALLAPLFLTRPGRFGFCAGHGLAQYRIDGDHHPMLGIGQRAGTGPKVSRLCRGDP